MKSIQAISDEITVLEAVRDYAPYDFTSENNETLKVLYFCYELLARTSVIEKLKVETHTEMKDCDITNDSMPKFMHLNDYFEDFVFSLVTKQGEVSLRDLLRRFISSQKEAAKIIDKRAATISDYLTNKSSFNCDSFEILLNAYIEKYPVE